MTMPDRDDVSIETGHHDLPTPDGEPVEAPTPETEPAQAPAPEPEVEDDNGE